MGILNRIARSGQSGAKIADASDQDPKKGVMAKDGFGGIEFNFTVPVPIAWSNKSAQNANATLCEAATDDIIKTDLILHQSPDDLPLYGPECPKKKTRAWTTRAPFRVRKVKDGNTASLDSPSDIQATDAMYAGEFSSSFLEMAGYFTAFTCAEQMHISSDPTTKASTCATVEMTDTSNSRWWAPRRPFRTRGAKNDIAGAVCDRTEELNASWYAERLAIESMSASSMEMLGFVTAIPCNHPLAASIEPTCVVVEQNGAGKVSRAWGPSALFRKRSANNSTAAKTCTIEDTSDTNRCLVDLSASKDAELQDQAMSRHYVEMRCRAEGVVYEESHGTSSSKCALVGNGKKKASGGWLLSKRTAKGNPAHASGHTQILKDSMDDNAYLQLMSGHYVEMRGYVEGTAACNESSPAAAIASQSPDSEAAKSKGIRVWTPFRTRTKKAATAAEITTVDDAATSLPDAADASHCEAAAA